MNTNLRFLLKRLEHHDARTGDKVQEVLKDADGPLQALAVAHDMLCRHSKTRITTYMFMLETVNIEGGIRAEVYSDSKLWVNEYPHSHDVYLSLELTKSPPGAYGIWTGVDPVGVLKKCFDYNESITSPYPDDQLFAVYSAIEWCCQNLEMIAIPEVIDDVFVAYFYDRKYGYKVTLRHDTRAIDAFWETLKSRIDVPPATVTETE